MNVHDEMSLQYALHQHAHLSDRNRQKVWHVTQMISLMETTKKLLGNKTRILEVQPLHRVSTVQQQVCCVLNYTDIPKKHRLLCLAQPD